MNGKKLKLRFLINYYLNHIESDDNSGLALKIKSYIYGGQLNNI